MTGRGPDDVTGSAVTCALLRRVRADAGQLFGRNDQGGNIVAAMQYPCQEGKAPFAAAEPFRRVHELELHSHPDRRRTAQTGTWYPAP